MNRWVVTLLFGVTVTLIGCKSAGPVSPPPGQGQGAPPAAPNPAPAPPQPVLTPPPTPGPLIAESPAGEAPAPAPAASAAAPEPPVPPAPAVAPAPHRPYQDILKLKQAGLSDEFLLNKIRTDNVPYQLTTPEIVELRDAGISEAVLEAMMRSGQTVPGVEVARKAEFSGLARVTSAFLGFGTSAKKTGRLLVDGENVSWFDAEDPGKNFSIYARNIKEVFNTCVLRPGQNLCLEFGFVTHTGDEYRFRDPGWKNGDNKLVLEATRYFRQAFPTLFFSQRAVREM